MSSGGLGIKPLSLNRGLIVRYLGGSGGVEYVESASGAGGGPSSTMLFLDPVSKYLSTIPTGDPEGYCGELV